MLRLTTEEHQPIMTAGTRISFIKRNNLVTTDDLYKDISYSFTLPIRGNEVITDFMHLLESSERNATIAVRMEVDGMPTFSGDMKIERADNDYYYASLEGSMGASADANEQLPALMNGEFIYYDNVTPIDLLPTGMNSYKWPISRYCWPYWRNDDADFISKYKYPSVNTSESGTFYLSSTGGTNPTALNICLYVPEALERISKRLGYQAKGTLFTNEDLCELIVWNNRIIDWNGGVTNVPVSDLLPDVTAIEFFNNLRAYGIVTTIDTVSKVLTFDSMDTVISKAEVCDVSESLDHIYEIETGDYEGLCQGINFSDAYGSKLTVETPYKVVASIAYIELYYGYEMDAGTYGADVFLMDLAGYYFYNRLDRSYYVVNDDYTFTRVGFDAVKRCEDGGELQIPEIETLVMDQQKFQRAPRLDHPMQDSNVDVPFDMKLLFFRGMQQDTQGYLYSYATCDNMRLSLIAPDYQVKYGKYSLIPSDKDSISNLITMPWYRRITSAKKYIGVLHGNWMLAHGFTDAMLLRRYSTNCIWSELEIDIGEDGYESTRVEMLKIS